MMQITSINNGLPRKAFFVALLAGALMLNSILFPDRAFAVSGIKSATQSIAPTRQERQSDPVEQGQSDGMKIFALRLRPGQDLRKEIERFTREKGIKAGFIITTVGSLEKAALRLANQNNASSFEGKFEIVSLVGTLSQDGAHLHVSLSDGNGKTIGGHLVEGCQIYTTAEIVIGEARGLVFTREADSSTGYKELKIRRSARPRKKK